MLTYHELLNQLFGLSLAEARPEFAIHLLFFAFKLANGRLSLLSWRNVGFPLLLRALRSLLTVHHIHMHGLLRSSLAGCWRYDAIDVLAEVTHRESVVLLVLILPRERVLPFRLLPEDLEHGALVDEVKAVAHGLNRQALASQCHLVDERV